MAQPSSNLVMQMVAALLTLQPTIVGNLDINKVPMQDSQVIISLLNQLIVHILMVYPLLLALLVTCMELCCW